LILCNARLVNIGESGAVEMPHLYFYLYQLDGGQLRIILMMITVMVIDNLEDIETNVSTTFI